LTTLEENIQTQPSWHN